MQRLGACGFSDGPRRSVIPRLGPLHATPEGFTPSQAIIRRLNAGPDAHRFDRLVGHTLQAAAALLYTFFALCVQPASAHDIYMDWKTEGGASCCHNKDCAPAIAWRDMNGGWTARQNGKDYIVPPYAVRPYQSPDGRSHLCVIGEAVMCFVPSEPKS